MKLLKLNNSNPCIMVDDIDHWRFGDYKWKLFGNDDAIVTYYKTKPKRLTNMIMGNPPEGFIWDHIDRNIFNNQRSNLRLATIKQNNQNRSKVEKDTSSVYKGVSLQTKGKYKYWIARITPPDDTRIFLGTFPTEKEAAHAYNKAALKYFGEFACLNIIKD